MVSVTWTSPPLGWITSSFFETFAPMVWMYLSSNSSCTKRRGRMGLPPPGSPPSTTLRLISRTIRSPSQPVDEVPLTAALRHAEAELLPCHGPRHVGLVDLHRLHGLLEVRGRPLELEAVPDPDLAVGEADGGDARLGEVVEHGADLAPLHHRGRHSRGAIRRYPQPAEPMYPQTQPRSARNPPRMPAGSAAKTSPVARAAPSR